MDEEFKLEDIKCLVISGGGFRGISFLGCLNFLEDKGLKKSQINKFIGTSIGALFSFLYIIGYSPEELFNIVLDKNLKELCSLSLMNLFKELGLDNGKKIVKWIEDSCITKNINPCITFKELKEKTDIDLWITGTNLNHKKGEIFNCVNSPDFEVITAIRLSIAVPFVFTPIKYNDCLYIDGAIINPLKNMKFDEKETLFLCIEEIEKDKEEIKNIYDFGFHVVSCLIKSKKHLKKDEYKKIKIYNENEDFLNFQMSASEKLKLFNDGVKWTKKFFETE